MQVIAESKRVRMSPRKLRLVADSIRGLPLDEVLVILANLNKRAAGPLLLTFKQAVGNAVGNFNLDKESLKIKEIQIGEGPTLKRWRAVSRGRARTIFKRASHVKIVLEGEKRAKSKEQRAKLQIKDKKD